MKSFLFESSFSRESRKPSAEERIFTNIDSIFETKSNERIATRNTRSLPKLMKLIFQIQIKTNDHNPNFCKGAKERKKRGGRSRNRSSDFLFLLKINPEQSNRSNDPPFSKIRLPSWCGGSGRSAGLVSEKRRPVYTEQ